MPFWTTAELPADQQFGFWREVLCEAYVALNPVRPRRGGFSGSVSATMVADINVTRLLTEQHIVDRGPAEIRRTPLEYYFVNMQVQGEALARQRGREVIVRPHEFYIVDSTEPYHLDLRTAPEIFSYRIPKRILDPLLKSPVDATAIRVSRETPMGAVAVDFLQSVTQQASTLPVSGHEAMARMMAELVALSLGRSATAEESAGATTQRAVFLSVRKYIDDNLHDPALSIASVCRRFRISPRNLHRAFEASEMTFGELVRAKRLDRSARELSQFPERAVSSVAFSCGFNDVSYFNRSFRKRFETSPTEYRRHNRRAPD
jgi:AraC family transcriptional regulator, positive regulator of tynA and feaB